MYILNSRKVYVLISSEIKFRNYVYVCDTETHGVFESKEQAEKYAKKLPNLYNWEVLESEVQRNLRM
jgi:hypothetical protein